MKWSGAPQIRLWVPAVPSATPPCPTPHRSAGIPEQRTHSKLSLRDVCFLPTEPHLKLGLTTLLSVPHSTDQMRWSMIPNSCPWSDNLSAIMRPYLTPPPKFTYCIMALQGCLCLKCFYVWNSFDSAISLASCITLTVTQACFSNLTITYTASHCSPVFS